MATFLLAYPRSGSSVARLLVAYLTEMKPAQASGGVEKPLADLLDGLQVKQQGEFKKYHKQVDTPFTMPLTINDTLLYLHRDPLEHLVSWAFSRIHPKGSEIDPEKIPELAGAIIRPPHKWLAEHVRHYYENERVFNDHAGPKVRLQYEDMLSDPEYLIAQLRAVREINEDRAELFRAKFEELKQRMLQVKSGDLDSIRVNTFGDPRYWHNTLLPEDVARFDAYMETNRPK